MLRRRTARQSDEDDLEHRLSAQQYQGSDGAQVVWIRVNEQNCWELLIGCRLAGNRTGLRRVMTNSCATVGTKKQEREEENLSSAAIVELNHVRHTRCIRRTDPSVWRLRQMHLFRAGTSQKRIALERMVRQWVWKSANTRPLHDLLLTSRLMTSSVGWTASFNSSRFRLSAAFQTVWAGSCEGCSPSIRAQNTSTETKKNEYKECYEGLYRYEFSATFLIDSLAFSVFWQPILSTPGGQMVKCRFLTIGHWPPFWYGGSVPR